VDKSGSIDFEEFKEMLERLSFNLVEAKALKYFRKLDTDGSGVIDLTEFRAAMCVGGGGRATAVVVIIIIAIIILILIEASSRFNGSASARLFSFVAAASSMCRSNGINSARHRTVLAVPLFSS
jgi:hypothetical protein